MCAECTLARERVWHGGYDHWCDGCMARAIARSQAAFHAIDERGNGDQRPLRELIGRCMQKVPYEDARRVVWQWWQVDHAKEVEAV
jgi:hypothetical protein